jgi:hypothetical protein
MKEDLDVWRPHGSGGKMLEWKPRLFVLMVLLAGVASLLGQFGWIRALQFGW